MIAEKNGVVGIAFFPDIICKKNATIEDVLKHIDHCVEIVGADYVGLGPDFIDYCLDRMIPELKQAKLKSYGGERPYPKGIEDVTEMKNITRGLVSHGYSDTEIRKILGENFLRVLKKVLG